MCLPFKAQPILGYTFGEPLPKGRKPEQLEMLERLCRAEYINKRKNTVTPVDEGANADRKLDTIQKK